MHTKVGEARVCISCHTRITDLEFQRNYVQQRNKIYVLKSELPRIENLKAKQLAESGQMKLYLDIDNTILYCEEIRGEETKDFQILPPPPKTKEEYFGTYLSSLVEDAVYIFHIERDKLKIRFRPGLIKFLQTMSDVTRIEITTTGTYAYARIVVGIIDPLWIYVQQITAREQQITTCEVAHATLLNDKVLADVTRKVFNARSEALLHRTIGFDDNIHVWQDCEDRELVLKSIVYGEINTNVFQTSLHTDLEYRFVEKKQYYPLDRFAAIQFGSLSQIIRRCAANQDYSVKILRRTLFRRFAFRISPEMVDSYCHQLLREFHAVILDTEPDEDPKALGRQVYTLTARNPYTQEQKAMYQAQSAEFQAAANEVVGEKVAGMPQWTRFRTAATPEDAPMIADIVPLFAQLPKAVPEHFVLICCTLWALQDPAFWQIKWLTA